MNFWIFDVQNPDDIKAGTAKPNLKERGPYAYKEIRKKVKKKRFQLDWFIIQSNYENDN